VRGFEMLTTVEFNDQLRRMTDEIRDVIANGGLPPEAQTSKAVSAQGLPDYLFSIC
jgi:hypothetical protein